MARVQSILVRRIYDIDRADDSYRVLVDRLWPRGVRKSDARLDEWLRDVAPSSDLRRWYHHDVERFTGFARRYRAELERPPASAAVRHLLELARLQPVTLLTATRDLTHSGATVLHEHLTAGDDHPRRRPVRTSAHPQRRAQ